RYDSLIYALGATSRLPQNAPKGVRNLVPFRTLDDVEVIQRVLNEKKAGGASVVVLGGGPMGLEAADGLLRAGSKATIVEKSSELLKPFHSIFSSAVEKSLNNKVHTLLGVEVTGFQVSNDAIVGVTLSSGAEVPCNLVVSAIGLEPRTELFQKAGGRVGAD